MAVSKDYPVCNPVTFNDALAIGNTMYISLCLGGIDGGPPNECGNILVVSSNLLAD
jgi:hypothetical protein